jgi:hypothetical protein
MPMSMPPMVEFAPMVMLEPMVMFDPTVMFMSIFASRSKDERVVREGDEREREAGRDKGNRVERMHKSTVGPASHIVLVQDSSAA